jgi:hypothetical protein
MNPLIAILLLVTTTQVARAVDYQAYDSGMLRLCNTDDYFCLGLRPKPGCNTICSTSETLYFFGPDDGDDTLNCLKTSSCPIAIIAHHDTSSTPDKYIWFVLLSLEPSNDHAAQMIFFWVSQEYDVSVEGKQVMFIDGRNMQAFAAFTNNEKVSPPEKVSYRQHLEKKTYENRILLKNSTSTHQGYKFITSNVIATKITDENPGETDFNNALYINFASWKYNYNTCFNTSLEVHTTSPVKLFKRKDRQNDPRRPRPSIEETTTENDHKVEAQETNSTPATWTIAAVVTGLVVILAAAFFVMYKKRSRAVASKNTFKNSRIPSSNSLFYG